MRFSISEEVKSSGLPDIRLERRFETIVGKLVAQPEASIPQAMGSWGQSKAAYRFFASDFVTAEGIRAGCAKSCIERAKRHSTVLIIQDTTSLDFTGHLKTKGLGYLETPKRMGLFVHTALAATTEGVPLGILAQDTWARDLEEYGKKHDRRKRPFEEKESVKWVKMLEASTTLLRNIKETITVADSEADIYELFVAEKPANAHLLIRSTHNRRVEGQARLLWDTVMQGPVKGQVSVEVGARDGKPGRTAECSVRFQTVTVYPPRNPSPGPRHRHKVTLQAVLVWEEAPPEGVEPLCWLLVTTLQVENFADALRCVGYYRQRWLVERYHFVLKSGCRIERLQLETAERIERALAVYSLVALRLLWLTHEARDTPDAPASCVLQEHEWQALYCKIHRTSTPPPEPPKLREAVRWIAQLGGFLGRKSDGEPGVMVIWRGLRRLEDIADTWLLLRPPEHAGATSP